MPRSHPFAIMLFLCLAAPVSAQEDLPPGYPPKIGVIEGRLGSDPAAWETFDFSVGAFDASAWIDTYDGIVLKLVGYPPGNPDAETGKLLVTARFAAVPDAGVLLDGAPVTFEIFDRDLDGPRLSSQGRAAQLMVDAVAYGSGPGSGYGTLRGRFSAELCPRGGKTGRCQRLEGRFDTTMQYSGIDRLPD